MSRRSSGGFLGYDGLDFYSSSKLLFSIELTLPDQLTPFVFGVSFIAHFIQRSDSSFLRPPPAAYASKIRHPSDARAYLYSSMSLRKHGFICKKRLTSKLRYALTLECDDFCDDDMQENENETSPAHPLLSTRYECGRDEIKRTLRAVTV